MLPLWDPLPPEPPTERFLAKAGRVRVAFWRKHDTVDAGCRDLARAAAVAVFASSAFGWRLAAWSTSLVVE
jgi:hypothetical protein